MTCVSSLAEWMAQKKQTFFLTTKTVFPKSLKFMNSGSVFLVRICLKLDIVEQKSGKRGTKGNGGCLGGFCCQHRLKTDPGFAICVMFSHTYKEPNASRMFLFKGLSQSFRCHLFNGMWLGCGLVACGFAPSHSSNNKCLSYCASLEQNHKESQRVPSKQRKPTHTHTRLATSEGLLLWAQPAIASPKTGAFVFNASNRIDSSPSAPTPDPVPAI